MSEGLKVGHDISHERRRVPREAFLIHDLATIFEDCRATLAMCEEHLAELDPKASACAALRQRLAHEIIVLRELPPAVETLIQTNAQDLHHIHFTAAHLAGLSRRLFQYLKTKQFVLHQEGEATPTETP